MSQGPDFANGVPTGPYGQGGSLHDPSGYPSGYPAGSYGQGYPTEGQPVPGYPAGYPGGHPGGPPGGYPAGYPAPPSYDPVTGQPLPPGAPAYSNLDPYAPPPAYQQAPPGYPAGYIPPGYQLVPMYPMAPTRPPRPGGAVAAAVLAFVQAGFVLLGSTVIFAGGTTFGFGNSRVHDESVLIGVLALLAGGLLIAGGTTILNRKPLLLIIGAVASLALSLYFIVRLSDFAFGEATWVPIVYAVLPIIAVALTMGSDVRSWVRARNNGLS